MHTHPDLTNTVDRLAHYLSEIHNSAAPVGWERYRFLAESLLAKFNIEDTVDDERFLDYDFSGE